MWRVFSTAAGFVGARNGAAEAEAGGERGVVKPAAGGEAPGARRGEQPHGPGERSDLPAFIDASVRGELTVPECSPRCRCCRGRWWCRGCGWSRTPSSGSSDTGNRSGESGYRGRGGSAARRERRPNSTGKIGFKDNSEEIQREI